MSGSVLLLHGVVRAAEARPADAPVVLAVGPLAALLGPAPRAALESGDPAAAGSLALAHHRLLAAVAAERDVVPVRFGAVFADADAAARAVAGRSAALEDRLALVAGTVEMAFTATETAPAEAPAAVAAASGRDYLRGRSAALHAARERRARIAAGLQALDGDLAALARSLVAHPLRADRPERRADWAVLVERTRIAEARALVAAAAPRLAPHGLVVGLDGPWPVYSFSDGGLEALDP